MANAKTYLLVLRNLYQYACMARVKQIFTCLCLFFALVAWVMEFKRNIYIKGPYFFLRRTVDKYIVARTHDPYNLGPLTTRSHYNGNTLTTHSNNLKLDKKHDKYRRT